MAADRATRPATPSSVPSPRQHQDQLRGRGQLVARAGGRPLALDQARRVNLDDDADAPRGQPVGELGHHRRGLAQPGRGNDADRGGRSRRARERHAFAAAAPRAQVQEELPVAFRAGDRRRRGGDAPQSYPIRRRGHLVHHAPVHRPVGHQPALADLGAPRLELRLDEHDDVRLRGQQRPHRRQHQLRRDERDVDGHDVHLPERRRQHPALEPARIDALQHGHARILAQLPRELAVADVDRRDPRRAALDEHVGEAAGRGADVQRGAPADGDAERVERVGQLDAAAPGVRVVGGRRRHVRRGRHRRARLRDDDPVDAHLAREHQRPRPGARGGQAALHHQRVEPRAAGHAPAAGAPPPPARRGLGPRLARRQCLLVSTQSAIPSSRPPRPAARSVALAAAISSRASARERSRPRMDG